MGYLAPPITVIFLGGLLWPVQEADVGGRDRINAGKVRESSWHGAKEVLALVVRQKNNSFWGADDGVPRAADHGHLPGRAPLAPRQRPRRRCM